MEVEPEENIPLAQSALDYGWEKIIDPDGPPAGLLQAVTDYKPAFTNALHLEEDTTKENVA
jgi:hypothetical protein